VLREKVFNFPKPVTVFFFFSLQKTLPFPAWLGSLALTPSPQFSRPSLPHSPRLTADPEMARKAIARVWIFLTPKTCAFWGFWDFSHKAVSDP